MANTAKETPTPTRSDSEISFVLRRAKWRQGPEVMRAIAAGEAPGGERASSENKPRDAKKPAARAGAKKR